MSICFKSHVYNGSHDVSNKTYQNYQSEDFEQYSYLCSSAINIKDITWHRHTIKLPAPIAPARI